MEDAWKAARQRMGPYIDPVFWQDLGVTDPEKRRSVDWILDVIVRPEFDRLLGAETPDRWLLLRGDDLGNEYVVLSELSYREASQQMSQLERRGHKQVYWIRRM